MGEDIKQIIKEVIDEYSNSREIQLMEENIEKINKLLLGNGGVGICEEVRKLQNSIIPLWTLVSVIGLALLTGLVKLFLG